MEFYSDMGDGQSELDQWMVRRIEEIFLPRCRVVFASSSELAEALVEHYRIALPIAAVNAPPTLETLPPRRGGGLNLYWRNSTIGFGQRGLEDALLALIRLPADVRLFLQGRPAQDGGAEVRRRIAELGVAERVIVLPPYPVGHAVEQAAPFDIGLCLERAGPRNHDLTISNKMFDYHMAGLAIVCTDLGPLRNTVARSGGGVVVPPSNPVRLAEAALRLRNDRSTLQNLQRNARAFALLEVNQETEMKKVVEAMRSVLEEGRGCTLSA